jgi:hypothetical protein
MNKPRYMVVAILCTALAAATATERPDRFIAVTYAFALLYAMPLLLFYSPRATYEPVPTST